MKYVLGNKKNRRIPAGDSLNVSKKKNLIKRYFNVLQSALVPVFSSNLRKILKPYFRVSVISTLSGAEL